MKKILIFAVLFGFVCAIVFGNGSQEQKADEASPFEGEWKSGWKTDNGQDYIQTFIFTGNKFEWLVPADDGSTYGTFSYTKNKITFINENPETKTRYPRWSYQYDLISYTRIKFFIDDYVDWFTKQPYFDIEYNLRTNESERNNFPINQEELANIQGSWKHTNSRAQEATYTFSGNEFTLTANRRNPVSGTVKINNNILVLITDNQVFGCYIYEFQPENILFLNELVGDTKSFWGEFKKQ
jgi:hypothetical protein